MYNLNFRKFVEEVSQEATEYAKDLIEKMKSWRPTVSKPYPSAGMEHVEDYTGIGDPDALDIAAVLAGTKPAASYDYDFAIKPVGVWLLRKIAKSSNLTMSSGFGFGLGKRKEFVVGKQENVNNIVNAYKELRHFLYPESEEEIQRVRQLHAIIGQNLGFPQEAIDKFINKLSPATTPGTSRKPVPSSVP